MYTLLDRGRRPGGRATLGALLLAFCLTLLALPASAHDTLIDSTPADGDVLDEVPTELRLTFSGEVSDLGVQFMVTGPEGRDVVQGTPTVDGVVVTQTLAEELTDGDYEAAWRVTSSDGHPISGTISFTLDAGADEPTTQDPGESTEPPAPTTGDDATAEPTGDDATAEPTGDTTEPTGDTTTDAEVSTADAAAVTDPANGSDGIPLWGWLVAAAAAVGLVACGFLAFRRG